MSDPENKLIPYKIFWNVTESYHKSEMPLNNLISISLDILSEIFFHVMGDGKSFSNLRLVSNFFQTVINIMYERANIDSLKLFRLNLITYSHKISINSSPVVKIMENSYICESMWHFGSKKLLDITNVNHCSDNFYCKKLIRIFVDRVQIMHTYLLHRVANETLNILKTINLNHEILFVMDDHIIIDSFGTAIVYEIETMKKIGKINDYVAPTIFGYQATHKNYLISYNRLVDFFTVKLSIYDVRTCEKIFWKNIENLESYSFYYPYLAISSNKNSISVYDVSQNLSGEPVYELQCGSYHGIYLPASFSVHNNVLCVHKPDGTIVFADIITKSILISYKTGYEIGETFFNKNKMFIITGGGHRLHVYRFGNDGLEKC